MKKLFSLALALFLLCAPLTVLAETWYCPNCGRQNDANFCPADGTAKPDLSGTSSAPAPSAGSNIRVGMTITFGRYEQDADTSDGREDIEWKVLDIQDGKALLLSRYVLDGQEFYAASHDDVRWEDSSLRGWLNEYFFYKAFNLNEQDAIGNPPDSNVMDYVTLLTKKDIEKYFPNNSDRLAVATPYAIPQINHAVNGLGENATCRWWLRTIGNKKHAGMYISHYDGTIYAEGPLEADYNVPDNQNLYYQIGVRPAIWVYLDAL